MLTINLELFYRHCLLPEEDKDYIEINMKLNNNKNIMGDYSLYKLYKYEQISLLISGINNWKINDTLLLIFIDSLKNQTLKELQIIFILPNEKENHRYNLIKTHIYNDNRMKIFSLSENEELNNYYLMDLITGKFIIILEKFIIFNKKELENLFLLTNGKIDNIFENFFLTK